MEEFTFTILTSNDREDIVALRTESFKNKYKNRIEIETLKWNRADDLSCHIGFRHVSSLRLVSYLRVGLYQSISHLTQSTRFSIDSNVALPCILLSRAATTSNASRIGLHSILRCRALEIAKYFSVHSVLGSLEANSSRLKRLLSLGYEVVYTQEKWPNSYLESDGKVVLISLKGENKIDDAILNIRSQFNLEPLVDMPVKMVGI